MKLTKLQIHRMFFLFVTTFAISLCVVLAGGKIRESEISLDDNEDPADVPYTVTISGVIVKRDLNNLFETSQLVAVCEIVSEPDSFYIQNVSGGKEILSDQYAKVTRVITGSPVSGTITIRQRGGTVGNCTELYTENPVLKAGEQYLLFLYQPDMGGSYHTEGDYYYIRGLSQGAYHLKDDGGFVSANGDPLTETDLTISAASAPKKTFSSRDEFLSNQKHNLENGMITKEAYEKAIAEIEQYAIILKDTE